MRRYAAVVVALPLLATPLVVAAPASAVDLNIAKVERSIKKGIKNQTGFTVKVKCPDTVRAQQGNTFYCTVKYSGQKYSVRVKQKNSQGDLRWRLLN